QQVTLVFSQPVGIQEAAERISRVTGLSTRVSPDVLSSRILTAASGAAPAQQPNQQSGAGKPQALSSSAVANVAGINDRFSIQLNYTGPLSGLLEVISARMGISWSFRDNTILFSRNVTKTFMVKALAGTTSIKADVNTASGQSISSSNNANSTLS